MIYMEKRKLVILWMTLLLVDIRTDENNDNDENDVNDDNDDNDEHIKHVKHDEHDESSLPLPISSSVRPSVILNLKDP